MIILGVIWFLRYHCAIEAYNALRAMRFNGVKTPNLKQKVSTLIYKLLAKTL